jgi:hypothetical protein
VFYIGKNVILKGEKTTDICELDKSNFIKYTCFSKNTTTRSKGRKCHTFIFIDLKKKERNYKTNIIQD